MKKSVVIAIILMSCLLIGCILLNNKKQEKIKKPQDVITNDYSNVQLDLLGIMAAYEEEQYYGNRLVKYTARIINGYGDVKNIELTEENLPINGVTSKYLQKCMRDEGIRVVENIGKVPDEILDKIKRITDIEPDAKELPKDRVTFQEEDTNYYYYCASGNGSGNLKLIQSYVPLKDYQVSSNNKDLKDVMKYFFGG